MEGEKQEKRRAYKSWQGKSNVERVIQKSWVPHWFNDSRRPDDDGVELGWRALHACTTQVRQKTEFMDKMTSRTKAC